MKISFKNIFQIIPSSFFFFITKISLIIFFFIVHVGKIADMDASHPWQVGFQDPATPIMEGIIFFNGLLMTFMIFIACLVGWLLYKSLSLFNESAHKNPVGFTHSTLLEVVWTIIPAVILMIISVPSYNLLYAMDEVIDPSLTIKVVGHQWYWSYECSDFDVLPHLQKVDSVQLEEAYKNLEFLIDVLEVAHREVEKGETETKLTIAKDFLNFLKDNKEKFPEEASSVLAWHLEFIYLFLQDNEGRKEAYGNLEERYASGELVDILSSVKEKLKDTDFLPEQKEAIIKILKSFKQYLRLTKESDLQSATKLISQELYVKFVLAITDLKGSDDKGSKFDGPDDDDDGSIVDDLIHFDKSNSIWSWCEMDSVKEKYRNDDVTLLNLKSDAVTSERICTDATLFPEENDTPFIELVEKMIKDSRKVYDFTPVADLSEDKLIDTQLIDHQLRLTRAEREGYSSKFALDTAIFESSVADNKFNIVLDELKNAKIYSHWSNIELEAAKVNKLTAEYLQADASLGVTDPLLIRSRWINEKGYFSWSRFLRLAAKKLSDDERLVFLKADENLNGANSLLGRAQRNLTTEERIRSNAIADNAKAEFMAMEREAVSAVEEFHRGKIILANAEADLKSFQDISNRASIRLEKAEIAFDKAKSIADRAKAKLNAIENVYNTAQSKLSGVSSIPELIDIEENFKKAQNNFYLLKEEFDEALFNLQDSKVELGIAEKRLKTVNENLNKTKKVFENTGLLELHSPNPRIKNRPIEYYPNHIWEMHNEDYEFVKTQLITDTAELEAVKTSVNLAEAKLSKIGSQLLEAELIRSNALIELLKSDSNNLDALNDEITHISNIKLGLAEAIYAKALNNFEVEGSKISESIVRRAEKGLLEAKIKGTSGYLDSFLKLNFDNLDSNKIISDYAEMCIASANEELIDAEKDYEKATRILEKTKVILNTITFDLSKDYDNPYLKTLRYLHKNTSLSLENSINQLNSIKIEFSPLDIKLEPGLLQSKSYREVVLAKAELANMKWLAARVAKTLDIPLNDEVKPFNVQFSYLNTEDSSNINKEASESINSSSESSSSESSSSESSSSESNSSESSSSESSSSESNSSESSFSSDDSKPKKSEAEIKEILSKIDDLITSETRIGFKKKACDAFSEVIKTLNDDTQNGQLFFIVDEALSLMTDEEQEKNQELHGRIAAFKEAYSNFKKEAEQEVTPINFDSYLIADDDLVIPEPFGPAVKAGKVFRLLEVDNRLFVPTNTHIRLLVTSADVLHSWAVPSLGIKVDACPGRLNQVFLFVKREGVFYGQCSELCGVNHGFMPIVVQAVSQDEYLTWVGKRLCS